MSFEASGEASPMTYVIAEGGKLDQQWISDPFPILFIIDIP